MKTVLVIVTLLALISCDMRSAETKELQSREVDSITVIDVYTGDTIQIEFSGNPGVADKAYKIKPKQR